VQNHNEKVRNDMFEAKGVAADGGRGRGEEELSRSNTKYYLPSLCYTLCQYSTI
jgi:hypothetical protein